MTTSFADLAQAADAEIDLSEAALLIAADEYPELDVGGWLAHLAAMGETVIMLVVPIVVGLAAFVGIVLGLRPAAEALEAFGNRGQKKPIIDAIEMIDTISRALGAMTVGLAHLAAMGGIATIYGVFIVVGLSSLTGIVQGLGKLDRKSTRLNSSHT